MSVQAIQAQERRALKTEPMQMFLLLAFLLACLYAVAQGAGHRQAQVSSVESFTSTELGSNKSWRDRLVAVENGTVPEAEDRWAGLAMDVVFPVTLSPGPLSDLAHGVSDVKPATARVSLWRSVDRLHGNYQFQSPIDTAAGAFDLAFVIIFIMPLLMIALSYDVLSEDKEAGRLGLLLSQPLTVRQLVTARLKVRLGAVAAILITVTALAAVTGDAGDSIAARLPFLGIWLLVALSYFLFWVAVIVWAISLNLRGETTALSLAGLWILNGLVGPASLSAAAESLHPTPSRLAFLTEAREASSAAYRSQANIMQGMLLDHPDLTVENYSMPEYIRTAYLVTKTVDDSVIPVLSRFDEVQAERRDFLGVLQYASPAVLTLQAFNLAAGTDLERHLAYEQSARTFKKSVAEAVEGNILEGRRLTVAEYDDLPKYAPVMLTASGTLTRVLFPIVFLSALALALGWVAFGRLDKVGKSIRED